MLVMKKNISLYSLDEFDGMRRAGRLAAETLDYITPFVVPGISTGKLDEMMEEFIISKGGRNNAILNTILSSLLQTLL